MNNIENQEISKIEIWMRTKKEIKEIGKEESINRWKMLTKKENNLQNKLRKESKDNNNNTYKQSKMN